MNGGAARLDCDSLGLLGPDSGRPLRQDQGGSVSDGETRWPVVAGIPFLRVHRESLRREALAALDAGDERRALVLLLADQDDFARTGPPDEASLLALIKAVDAGTATLRDAMAALRFGPVGDYFAFRWSSPTYLSGLALLERFGGNPSTGPVIEVACGIGHYLRDLALRGRAGVGLDVVFSKLWLARRFLVPSQVPLICADVAAGLPLRGAEASPAVAFCHDAFYFLPAQHQVLRELRRVVGAAGSILVGHAHNRNFDHGGVAGDPHSPAEYRELWPGCSLFDDAELARSVWARVLAPERSDEELARVEAVALVQASGARTEPASGRSLLDPVPGTPLRLNPLLIDRGGTLEPAWPSPRFEREYAAESVYLRGEPTPSAAVRDAAAQGVVGRGTHPEVDRLARRRVFLDLPERW